MKTFVLGLLSAFCGACLLAASPATADGDNGKAEKRLFTKHFQGSLFDITEHAAYSVEILLDDKEYDVGKDVIGIVIHNYKDSDVVGAKLTITQTSVSTKEQALGPLTVTDKGNGLYIISGLNLKRAGQWELLIDVQKDNVKDSARFILPDAINKRFPKGRYSP